MDDKIRLIVGNTAHFDKAQFTGTHIEMASRLLEPALLALAVLAVRGRIKR